MFLEFSPVAINSQTFKYPFLHKNNINFTIYQFLIPVTIACSTFEVCKKHFKFLATLYGSLCRS